MMSRENKLFDQSRRLCRLALLLFGVILLASPGLLFAHGDKEASLPPPDFASKAQSPDPGVGLDEELGGQLPLDLLFRDEKGRTLRLGDLLTGPTIILPVYYSCTNVCNFLQQGLARALPAVQRQPGKEYRVLSLSFDETETPELAARYQRTYLTTMNAPFPEDAWLFLTGDAKSIHALTAAAGYRFQRQGRDFIHPVASFVVAKDGTIVRYLYGTTFLPKDLTLALLEARDGRVGVTIRKVVGYCFSFDPAAKTYVFNLLRISATVVLLCAGSFLAYLLLTGKKRRKESSGGS
jgi:protein SCO1/2